jgi:VIT1/CCC1 family predicted Fe2+/Mn2+ transporter
MRRYLDTEDILLEIIFGLLVIMTFTMAYRAVDTHFAPDQIVQNQVQRMLIAAIGCTIAWGLIDAVITVMTNVSDRAREARIITNIRNSKSDDEAIAILGKVLDEEIGRVTEKQEREEFYKHIASKARTITPEPEGVKREDVYSAIVVMLAAITATLPALTPYLFVSDPVWAIRMSNFVAIAMLFGVGYTWAKAVGGKPVKIGLLVAIVGVVIVLVAIPLGG